MTGTIAWLVPYPLAGSGGHRTIYQNIAVLSERGFECHIYVEAGEAGHTFETAAEAKAVVEDYFGAVPATFHLGLELDRPFDVAFATAWFTADPLRASHFPRRKAYFIQDMECFFMPVSDAFMMAQNSFRYGFQGVTIGRWLASRVHRDFQMPCSFFDFCADKAVYRSRVDGTRERAVCFVYQPEKPRRCTVIGAQALAIVKSELPNVKVYFYGSDRRPSLPFEFDHLGLISVDECNDLYNKCQVGLCISATNPSRIPFEMMAAGLPVVDIFGENNLQDMPDDAVLLAEPTPESIAHAILGLLQSPEDQRRRSDAGVAFMRNRDLRQGFEQFVTFVERMLAEPNSIEPLVPELAYRQPAVIASEATKEGYRVAQARAAKVRAAISGADPFPATPSESRSAPDAGPAPPVAPAPRLSLTARTARRLEHTLRVLLTGR